MAIKPSEMNNYKPLEPKFQNVDKLEEYIDSCLKITDFRRREIIKITDLPIPDDPLYDEDITELRRRYREAGWYLEYTPSFYQYGQASERFITLKAIE
ncbi:hypothetical protein D3C75_628270 [compost metagenome]